MTPLTPANIAATYAYADAILEHIYDLGFLDGITAQGSNE